MEVKKLDHFCIAVRSIEAARKTWESILGRQGHYYKWRELDRAS